MSSMTLILVSLLALSFLGFIGVLIFSGSGKKQKQDRMKAMIINRGYKSNLDQENQDSKNPKSSRLTQKELGKKLKAAEGRAEAQKNRKSLTSMIAQAGFETPLIRFWFYSLIFGSLCAYPIWNSGLSMVAKSLIIFSAYFGAPRFFLKWRAKKRQRIFLQDFANALEDIIRLLKAGMPVTEAISMVAREYTGPVGDEMQRVYELQRLGTPLPEAVQKMTLRLPLPEVQMFATTIAIQVQTGSSLSEILGNLANVIRGRYSLKRKVVSLSSEAKISAGIIGSIPVVLAGVMFLLNRDYVMLLIEHPTGQMLTTIALGLMAFGIIVMRQMINFKV